MFKDYSKRLFICVLGLAVCGLSNLFSVKAGAAGTSSWTSLAIGISGISGMSFGSATFLVSISVILVDLLGRGKLGIGTILNAILVAAFSDMFLNLFSFIPEASNSFTGTICTLVGQTLLSFGTVLYMHAALGCGPRDTLMVLLGRKLPRFPIGAVRFCLECCVLVVALLLGAPFGLGTVAVMLLQATIFQFACNVCRYEPRNVEHEDIIDTYKRIKEAL